MRAVETVAVREVAGRRRLSLDAIGILKLVVVTFFGIFLVVPVLALLLTALTGDLVSIFGSLVDREELMYSLDILRHETTLDYIMELFREPRYMRATVNSLGLSLAVSITSLVLTMPIAYGLARTSMAGKRLIGALSLVPLIVPTFISAYGFMLMFGRTGWVTQLAARIGLPQPIDLQSGFAIYAVQVLTFFPFALLPSIAAFKMMDATLEEAAQSLGASRWLTWLTVTGPLALPGLAVSALLIFVVTLSDFGAPIILAPRNFPLLPVEAYREMSGYFNWAGAATLALLLVLLASFFLYLQKSVLRGRNYELDSKATRPSVDDRRITIPLFIYSLGFLLIPIAILVSVALQSLATTWGLGILPDGYTLDNYRHVFEYSTYSIKNSLVLGLGALLVSLVIGGTTAYLVVRREAHSLDFIATMPLAIPGVALGIALIQTFNMPPLELTGTAFLLIIAYALRRLPHMLRTSAASLMQVKQHLEEAALSLGATPGLMITTVVLPLVMPGIVAGAMLVFVTVIKEISITVLLAPANWAPMSLEVFRLLLRGELYIASALAILIVVIVTVFQLLAQRLAGEKALF